MVTKKRLTEEELEEILRDAQESETCNLKKYLDDIRMSAYEFFSRYAVENTGLVNEERPLYFAALTKSNDGHYEMWTVVTTDGRVIDGLLVSETGGQIQLKDAKAIVHTIPADEIDAKQKQDISLMPADLQKVMTAEELVDVVEYMTTLKKRQ